MVLAQKDTQLKIDFQKSKNRIQNNRTRDKWRERERETVSATGIQIDRHHKIQRNQKIKNL